MSLIESSSKEIILNSKKLSLLERINKISLSIKNRKKLTYSELENAIYHFEKEEYVEARELLKKVLRKSKDNLEARYILGQCFVLLGEFNKAVRQFGYILNSLPDEEMPLFQCALANLESKKYKNAEELFLKYLSLDHKQNLKDVNLFLGELYFETGKWELAIDYVMKSRKLKYKTEEGHFVITASYMNLGDYKLAKKWLDDVIRRYPTNKDLKRLKKELESRLKN